MNLFKKALKEVNAILDEVLIFNTILNSILVFLGTYIILMLLNLNPWWSLFAALGYLIYVLHKDITKSKLGMVETAYAPLYERLSTAADNADRENEMVEELKKEVVHHLHKVPVSSFVKVRKVSGKILASVLLCFGILLVAIYNINLGALDIDLAQSLQSIMATGDGGDGAGLEGVAGQSEGGDIFGEEDVAELGTRELQMTIKQASTEVVSSFIDDPPNQDFEETFPDEVFAESAGSFEEKISSQHQKLVKEYFKELAKG
jgi:hypothetical protein